MKPGWVAGTARARSLARRRLGRDAAADLARRPGLPVALEVLATTPYGRLVRTGMDLGAAQHALAASALWHLRVLAGWLRPDGVEVLRALAGRYEIDNIEDRLVGAATPPLELGALAPARLRLAPTVTPGRVREALSGTWWGDPGTDEPGAIGVVLRLVWAARLAATAPAALPWGAGLAALVSTPLLEAGMAHTLPPRVRTEVGRLLGPGWDAPGTSVERAGRLPRQARWVFSPGGGPEDLWRAHVRWWGRVEADGLASRASTDGPEVVLGVGLALMADAWRAGAALEAAARGGTGEMADVLG